MAWLIGQRNSDNCKVDHNFSNTFGDRVKRILYGLDKLKVGKKGFFKSNW